LKEVRSILLTYWVLESSLGIFSNLIAVVLVTGHPLTMAFHKMRLLICSSICNDLHSTLEYRAYIIHTHILHSVKLIFYTWFSHHQAHLAPSPRDFKPIIHQILMQVYVLQTLLSQLYLLIYSRKNNNSATSIPSTISTGASSNSSGSGAGSGRTSISGASPGTSVSSLTTLTGGSTPTGSSGIPPGHGAHIINLYPIPAVVNLVTFLAKLKDIIGTMDPPKLDNGGETCLSFLLHNGCWSNCHHATQHNSALTANEQTCLTQYLTQCMAVTTPHPNPTPAPTPSQAS